MSTFNPVTPPASNSGDIQQATINDALPSGDYLIRIVWFDTKRSQRSGSEYYRVKYEIIAGEYSNSAFFSNLSCQHEVGAVAQRWRAICKALNIQESFEIGGAQGSKDFSRLFKDRPFKARVSRSESDGYVNFDIQKTYGNAQWTENETKAVQEIADKALNTSADSSADDDIPF